MRKSGKSPAILAIVAAILLSTAGLAWACTPRAKVYSLVPEAAPVRFPVKATGQVPSPGTPVEIRWNSSQGPVVGTATSDSSGAFSTDVSIPDVRPGIYTLLFVAEETGVARSSFEVLPSPAGQAAPKTAPVAPGQHKVSLDLWTAFASPQGESAFSSAASEEKAGFPVRMAVGAGLVALGILGAVGAFAASVGKRRPADS